MPKLAKSYCNEINLVRVMFAAANLDYLMFSMAEDHVAGESHQGEELPEVVGDSFHQVLQRSQPPTG